MPEKDPHDKDQHEPGAKLDAGKVRMELLQDFDLALEAVAKIATFGAAKYSDGGWLHVPEGYRRYTGAMQRHFYQELREPVDKDSGMPHIYQTAWNALARLQKYLEEQPDEKAEMYAAKTGKSEPDDTVLKLLRVEYITQCRSCGRDYHELLPNDACPSEDCPSSTSTGCIDAQGTCTQCGMNFPGLKFNDQCVNRSCPSNME